MSNLILRLRGMTNSGTADYSIAGVTYWTDNHLQDALDAYRLDLNRVALTPDPEYSGGTALYHDYYAPRGNLEEAAGGSAVWSVEDGDGDEAGTANYTADYLRGVIRFTADQAGTAYYLRARSYDLNLAAAEVWRKIAAHFGGEYDVASDNHELKRSQKFTQAVKMAAFYESQAGPQFARMVRDDLA